MSMWPKQLSKQDQKFLKTLHVAIDDAPQQAMRDDARVWQLMLAERVDQIEKLEDKVEEIEAGKVWYRSQYEEEAQAHVETLIWLKRWQWAAAIGWLFFVVWAAINISEALRG